MLKRVVLTALLFALGCQQAVFAAVVESVRSYRAPEYTRLVFDLDRTLEHRIFTLDGPDRVVVDLVDAEMRGDFDLLALVDTPISSVRSAQNGKDIRIVLDLRGKVQPRSFILGPNEQYGDRLVIDLYDQQQDAATTAPQTANTSARVPDETKRDIVIAVSAGHGGDDPGAIGVNRLREKDVVLAISRELVDLINRTPGYKAVMIRDGDYYVGLREQIDIAHEHNADLFIAIHADAHTNASATGSTIYALSQNGATSEQARRLADKENASDLIGGVGSVTLGDKDEVLRSVLLDLSITGTIATSLEIGDRVIRALDDVVKMRRRNVEQAAFVVLKSADIPSLLVESGYITNPNDAKNLGSPVWRQRFAGALADGITNWFFERPPRGTLIAWQKDNGATFTPAAYTVKRGDNLSEIAERYGVSLANLKQANDISGNVIHVGQTLKIPGGGSNSFAGATPAEPQPPTFTEHTISRGETLSQIADSYSVPMARIRETNQLKSDTIRVGQKLKIPTS